MDPSSPKTRGFRVPRGGVLSENQASAFVTIPEKRGKRVFKRSCDAMTAAAADNEKSGLQEF